MATKKTAKKTTRKKTKKKASKGNGKAVHVPTPIKQFLVPMKQALGLTAGKPSLQEMLAEYHPMGFMCTSTFVVRGSSPSVCVILTQLFDPALPVEDSDLEATEPQDLGDPEVV